MFCLFKCEHPCEIIYHKMSGTKTDSATAPLDQTKDVQREKKLGKDCIQFRKKHAHLCMKFSYALLAFCIFVTPYMFNVMLKKNAGPSTNSLLFLPTFTWKNFNETFSVQSCIVVFFTVWIWFRSGKRLDPEKYSIEYVTAQYLLCMQAYILWFMAYNSDVEQERLQHILLALSAIVLCLRRYMVSRCPEGFDPQIADYRQTPSE